MLLVELSRDGAMVGDNSLPPEGPDAHECPRREPEARAQLADFLNTNW